MNTVGEIVEKTASPSSAYDEEIGAIMDDIAEE